jgi:hypothetical protein
MLAAKKTATTLYDAVNAALTAVERELKEFRDQRRGVVKEPGPRIRGRILRIFRDRGYRFAETESTKRFTFTPTLCTASLLRRSKWVWSWISRSRLARRGRKPLGSLRTCLQCYDGAGGVPSRVIASGGEQLS